MRRLLSPEEAYDVGMVDRVVPAGQVVPAAPEWCERLLAAPPGAMLRTRAVAPHGSRRPVADQKRSGPEECIEAWSNEETQATMRALVARRKDKC